MVEADIGVTVAYSALKNAALVDEPVLALRTLHESLDRAVLDAYGWTDIDVPPFCPLNADDEQALEHFKDTVIDRLLRPERRARPRGGTPRACQVVEGKEEARQGEADGFPAILTDAGRR